MKNWARDRETKSWSLWFHNSLSLKSFLKYYSLAQQLCEGFFWWRQKNKNLIKLKRNECFLQCWEKLHKCNKWGFWHPSTPLTNPQKPTLNILPSLKHSYLSLPLSSSTAFRRCPCFRTWHEKHSGEEGRRKEKQVVARGQVAWRNF